jgi:hypothetical protein
MWFNALLDIIGIGGKSLQAKANRKMAKVEGEIKLISNAADSVADWEQLHAKGSQSSWKDEYWTIIWSIPIIMGFIDIGGFHGPAYTAAGFEAFKLMPEWYQYTLVTMVLASFGIRAGGTIKSLMGK